MRCPRVGQRIFCFKKVKAAGFLASRSVLGALAGNTAELAVNVVLSMLGKKML